MNLEEYGEPLAYETAFWMQGLSNPSYPLNDLGRLALAVSSKLRTIAIMALLVKGASDLFYHNLVRSGMVREVYLQRLKGDGIEEDHHLASGRYDPLLDAVAAGDFALARRIVRLSPTRWQVGHEYEDDYCYAQVIHNIISRKSFEASGPILERFESYLGGQSNARFDICRALLGGIQEMFDEAFESRLFEREAEIAADKKRGQLEEPEVLAERRVFIEGLAILRLSEMRGLRTESEYRYCPSLARVMMKTAFPGK